ncbi:MAG: WD40 repeat domain-containing serine/threonine protein kinase [Verrucomicrobiales bacterium]
MRTIVRPDTSPCPDCGRALSEGVCVACAFGGLLRISGTPGGDGVQSSDIDFGRYRLRQRLAAGGMGVVYSAEDRQLKRTVALKMIRGSTFANASEIARFTVEAEAAAALDHPNIVPIYEVGSIDDQPFFTMKLIEGHSLGWHLKNSQGGRMETRQVATWLSQIARAVHHAHQRGVLHRDLKPGNILIDKAGFPWLTDFGLAKLMHGECGLTMTTDHLGTPNYMSPEVVKGTARAVSTASDVWALGVILWEAICGKLPFAGSSPVKVMRRIAEEEPAWPHWETIDKDLLTLASRCLEKDPAQRLKSADHVADELDRWLNGEPLSVRRATAGERVLKWVRRKPAQAALAAVLAVSSVSSLYLWQRSQRAVDSLTETNDQLTQSLAIATATRLAVDARLGVSKSPTRSLQQAIKAVEITEQTLAFVLPEAADSLFSILQQTGGWDVSPTDRADRLEDGFLDFHAASNHPVQCSPDGRWLLTFDYLSEDGLTAAIFDLHSGGSSAPLFRWTLLASDSHLKAASWLNDSSSFVCIDQTGSVRLWELPLKRTPQMVGQRSACIPTSRLLGILEQPATSLASVWLKGGDELSSLEGVAVFQPAPEESSREVGEDRLLTFKICSDRLPAISEKQLHSLGRTAKGTKWALSPCRQWLWNQAADGAWLYKLDKNALKLPHAELPEDSIVYVSAFSPDGRWLALRREAQRVHIYDLQSGNPHLAAVTGSDLYVLDFQIGTLAFSPDGTMLAVAGKSPTVAVISTESGRLIDTLRASGKELLTASFSGDGDWLTAGSMERTLSIWPTGMLNRAPEPMQFLGAQNPIVGITMAPDGKSVIAACSDARYRQWSFDGSNAGSIPQLLPRSESAIIDMERSPDGEWIVAACGLVELAENERKNRGPIRLIDTTRNLAVSLTSHDMNATGVAFSPDGKWVASTGSDGLALVWDFPAIVGAVRAGSPVPKPIYTFDMTQTRLEYPRRLAFHPRGTLFATCGDGILFEWDLNDPNPAATHVEYRLHSIEYLLPDVAVSPDGRWLAVARHGFDAVSSAGIDGSLQNGNMVLLYDVSAPGPLVFRAALPANFMDQTHLDFSRDSRWLAAGSSGARFPCVWDLSAAEIESSRRLAEISAHLVAGVAFSPDGHWLGLGGSDGRIHLWDWRKERQMRTISSGNAASTLLWLDGSRLVSGSESGEIAAWETDITRLKQLARRIAGADSGQRFPITDTR